MNPVKYKFPVHGILQLADTKLNLELIQMMFGCKKVMALKFIINKIEIKPETNRRNPRIKIIAHHN